MSNLGHHHLIEEEVVRCCVHVCKQKSISLFKKILPSDLNLELML